MSERKNTMQEYLDRVGKGGASVEAEPSFRRGYHLGYDKAIEDIFNLLNDGTGKERTYALSALHANLLGVWRTENCDRLIPPPHFNKVQLLETLEHRRTIRRDEEEGE